MVIASYSEGARERLQGLIEDQEIARAVTLIRDFRDVPDGKGGMHLAVWALEHGFESEAVGDRKFGVTVISEQDVSGRPSDPAAQEKAPGREFPDRNAEHSVPAI